jgi:hypothetical protein
MQVDDAYDVSSCRDRSDSGNLFVQRRSRSLTEGHRLDMKEGHSLGAHSAETCMLGKAVLAAIDAGRILDACKQLSRLEQAGLALEEFFSPPMLEHVRRVESCFEASMDLLCSDADSSWKAEKLDEGTEFRYKLSDGEVHLVSTAMYNDVDILRAFAAVCEVDLCKGYKPNVTSVEPLVDQCTVDSIWRIFQRGMISGRREDNIVQVSAVDALDEPLRSLWVSIYAPWHQGVTELRGVPIPPPQAGATRHLGRSTVCLTPNGDGSGFQMKMALSAPAPRAVNMMPSFALKAFMRKCAKETVFSFSKHINYCTELDQRVSNSDWYASVREHVFRTRGKTDPTAPKVSAPFEIYLADGTHQTFTPSTTPIACSSVSSESSSTTCVPADGEYCNRIDHICQVLNDSPSLAGGDVNSVPALHMANAETDHKSFPLARVCKASRKKSFFVHGASLLHFCFGLSCLSQHACQ